MQLVLDLIWWVAIIEELADPKTTGVLGYIGKRFIDRDGLPFGYIRETLFEKRELILRQRS